MSGIKYDWIPLKELCTQHMINLRVLFLTYTVRNLQDIISKNVYYYFGVLRGREARSEECKTGERREIKDDS